jgi:hypothetical protein
VLERLRSRRTTESGSKQRLRAIKRAKPSKEGKGPAPQGQRKAIRGNRTRQRRT